MDEWSESPCWSVDHATKSIIQSAFGRVTDFRNTSWPSRNPRAERIGTEWEAKVSRSLLSTRISVRPENSCLAKERELASFFTPHVLSDVAKMGDLAPIGSESLYTNGESLLTFSSDWVCGVIWSFECCSSCSCTEILLTEVAQLEKIHKLVMPRTRKRVLGGWARSGQWCMGIR